MDRSGALWGFLGPAVAASAGQVADRLRQLGRGVEISGQLVATTLLDLTTLRVRYDATEWHTGPAGRFAIEGDRIR